MYYFSLTRCAVGGTVDTGAGPEKITGGQGWFDHQWGNSWVASNDGWDWWGVAARRRHGHPVFPPARPENGPHLLPAGDVHGQERASERDAEDRVHAGHEGAVEEPEERRDVPAGVDDDVPGEGPATTRSRRRFRTRRCRFLGPGAGIWEGLVPGEWRLSAAFGAEGRNSPAGYKDAS